MSEPIASPAVGAKAPSFALHNDQGNRVRLSDFSGQRLIIFFYPAAMTPGCTKQACDFRDNMTLLAAHDVTVIGVSPDAPARLAEFSDAERLPFLLLSDPTHTVMSAYGAWGEKQLYGKTVTGVIRSTFVLDPKGRIEHAWYGVKATGHVARLLRDLGLS